MHPDVSVEAAIRRDQSAPARLSAADKRDEVALARDLAAATRDQDADARGVAFVRREDADERDADSHSVYGSDIIIRAAGQPQCDARHRAQATEQDARADDDRRGAARDREQAAAERVHAFVDRELLATALAVTEVDALTGARTRVAGLKAFDEELDRRHRTNGPLVVAYVDVIGLKSLNDTEGHGAGDKLLIRVVALIREHLRSYDLIIRLGGDEFLCVMSNVSSPDARRRFTTIDAVLDAAPETGAIRIGFAEFTLNDSASDLIARADGELIDGGHSIHAGDRRAATPSRASG